MKPAARRTKTSVELEATREALAIAELALSRVKVIGCDRAATLMGPCRCIRCGAIYDIGRALQPLTGKHPHARYTESINR